jgi:hypothetical protein
MIGKLKPRFYESYRITAIINDAAYQLELPPRAHLHDVFLVGLLKQFMGMPPHRQLFLRSTMVPPCRNRNTSSALAWPGVFTNYWYTGRA